MVYTVLGAGFSGLSAGVSLALSGERVQIFDQQKHLGGKFHESVQAMRNYGADQGKFDEFKKFGLDLGSQNPIHKIVKYSPSMKKSVISSDGTPLFYSFKRGNCKNSIDILLAEQAQDLGAKFVLGKREPISNADIVATGPFFFTGVGFEAHYKDLDVDSETIHFFLNNDWAPYGYSCIIPYGKHEATVMVASFDLTGFNFVQKQFHALLSENKVVSNYLDGGTKINEYGAFGFYNVPKTAKIKGKLFVGEAAGFVDASRGFGTRYAIESGILASKALSENLDYDSLWKSAFETELLQLFKRRLGLNKLQNRDYERVIEDLKKEPTNFIKSFFVDNYTTIKLNEWRKHYDLSKIVKF